MDNPIGQKNEGGPVQDWWVDRADGETEPVSDTRVLATGPAAAATKRGPGQWLVSASAGPRYYVTVTATVEHDLYDLDEREAWDRYADGHDLGELVRECEGVDLCETAVRIIAAHPGLTEWERVGLAALLVEHVGWERAEALEVGR